MKKEWGGRRQNDEEDRKRMRKNGEGDLRRGNEEEDEMKYDPLLNTHD